MVFVSYQKTTLDEMLKNQCNFQLSRFQHGPKYALAYDAVIIYAKAFRKFIDSRTTVTGSKLATMIRTVCVIYSRFICLNVLLLSVATFL